MRPGALMALLTMRACPGVGDRTLSALLRRHESAESALTTLERERPEAVAHTRTAAVRGRIEYAFRSIEVSTDVTALAIGCEGYPVALLDLYDPPPLLFARGSLEVLTRPTVAVVGTRANTEYGADVTRLTVSALAGAGVVVISGLAHGIDRIAHETALESGGPTAAVVGCGIDVVYPRQHACLQDRVAREGLLLSEFLPGEPARPHNFPRRNRILAALAQVVVVVEAPGRSGALITAEHALDLGREVLAVPGPVGRRTSEGTNALIRDGAGILLEPADVLVALGIGSNAVRAGAGGTGMGSPRESAGPKLTGAAAAVAAKLTDEPQHVDDLVTGTGLAAATVLSALLDLEVAGHARAFPGARYSL